MSIVVFVVGAALLIYSADKLVSYLVGAASGLRISVFLLAIIFTSHASTSCSSPSRRW